MRNYATLIFAATLIVAAAELPSLQDVDRNTADRIAEYNYPAETHNVHTADGYILTLFRIPYSPSLQNQNSPRPAVYLQHGIFSSSDGWILSGPDNALPYLLADAGYDVWLGNARGNTYSKQHETLSPSQSSFWNFSWHEIGLYDISAVIDHILDTTNQPAIHYIGHSMGTAVFLVLLSLKPEYNEKIKTSHQLAPLTYAAHLRGFITTLPAPILGYTTPVTRLVENVELLPHVTAVAWLGSVACSNLSPIQPLCADALFLIFGGYSTHVNRTVLPDFFQTHPAGTSSNTYIHFLQEYESGYFRWYDHGLLENLNRYKQPSPPSYDVSKVVTPIWMYYGDSDFIGVEADIKKIEAALPNVMESFDVPYPDWNHLDFLFGLEAKEVIFDRIIKAANEFEAMGMQ